MSALHHVKDADAATRGYPVTGTDARAGHIRVVPAKTRPGNRSYGYCLLNTRLNKSFGWYRFKRDAVAKAQEIKTYGLNS